MKHYAAYSQEQNRTGDQPTGAKPAVNEVISERAMREIYLPAFEAAVKKGGVASVMCSFPRINGVYACENPYTLGVLKSEWGFQGMVGPDFPDAQRSIVPAFKAGLDNGTMVPPQPGAEMGSEFVGTKTLRQAVDDGEISESRIDDMIRRYLVIPFRIGMFDHPVRKVSGEVSTPERRAAAVDLVTSGAVLLKNRGNVLPFGSNVKSIAIIGTQATDQAIVVEQGSPYVKPLHLTPVLDAVKQRAGTAVQVSFAQGTLGLQPLPMLPGRYLKTPGGQSGVQAEYFPNPSRDFSGKPLAVRTEPALSLERAPAIDGLPEHLQWSVRYTTVFTPEYTGTQRFTLSGSGEARLFIGGKLIGEIMRADFQDIIYANVPMAAGKPVEIRVEYSPREAIGDHKLQRFGIVFGPNLSLGWAGPDNKIDEAAEAARKADVAVVCVGHQLGEGMDRPYLNLPNDQDALIEAVAASNPRTIVVLNTGGAVLMPWLDKVAGVLETWLPGDAIGPATTKLLFGDAEPGGRLPVTFPADEKQGPGIEEEDYPGTVASDGHLETVQFSEGIFVGYRYWDQHGQKPLFPFGYGLSYGSFALGDESVKSMKNGGAEVAVKVTNTSKRAGSEVVQVYVQFPGTAGEPPRQLKGFEKVALTPGEGKTVHIQLSPEAFRYWDETKHAWQAAVGEYQLIVARSSRDVQWQSAFTPQL
jgi:beta-glucosidase